MCKVIGFVLINFVCFCHTLFVPEELPTILSFLYTNIPPITKGTDSRLGLGFRVGPNADFQVLLELGPQTRTKNLEPDKGLNKKRNVMQTSDYHVPHAFHSINGNKNTPMGWLMAWKSSVESYEDSSNNNQYTPIDNVPVNIDYNTIEHLQQLYKEQPHQESNISQEKIVAVEV